MTTTLSTSLSTIIKLQLVGILTLISYIYYLPKIDKKKITANMPEGLSIYSLVSVCIAIFCYIYIMYNLSGIKDKSSSWLIYMFIISFLVFSSLWAPSLYYNHNITTTLSLIAVAICSIGFFYILFVSKKFKNNTLLLIVSIYLIFHTLVIDGVVWNYYSLSQAHQ